MLLFSFILFIIIIIIPDATPTQISLLRFPLTQQQFGEPHNSRTTAKTITDRSPLPPASWVC